jgi:hypothetical protein
MYTKLMFIFSLVVVSSLSVSCFKTEEFPVEPVISDPSFVISGDSAVLSFHFTDGDGDIGLGPDIAADELPPYDSTSYYYYNIYCDYYEKDDVNGWQQGTDLSGDPISFRYRIHRIIVKGKQRGIKGTIDIAMQSFKNPFSAQSDTIKYTVKLIDRALNESNVIETEVIIP